MNRRLLIVTLASWLMTAPAALLAQSSEKADAPAAKAPAPTTAVNLNTASAAQLEALPGIGAKTAALILEYRKKNGSFKKAEELMNIKGIGEKSFLKLKNRVTVSAPKE